MAEERAVVSEKVCPKCGKTYRGHPAISRVDNVTAICPLCGTREALDSLGISDEEKEKIIATIPQVEDK
jgi:RNA polymerase subunit RPABC4/transcription elongation factor Spt4